MLLRMSGRRGDPQTLAATRDGVTWQAGLPGGELDAGRRPDGLHYTEEYLPEIAKWLGPKIESVGRARTSP